MIMIMIMIISSISNWGYQDSLLLLFFLLKYFAQKKHTSFIQISHSIHLKSIIRNTSNFHSDAKQLTFAQIYAEKKYSWYKM